MDSLSNTELQRHIHLLSEQLQDARLRLTQAEIDARAGLRAQETFLVSMNRRFRTPMNAIMGFTQLLRRGDTTPDQARHLAIIADAAKELMAMFDELSAMAAPASRSGAKQHGGPLAEVRPSERPQAQVQDSR